MKNRVCCPCISQCIGYNVLKKVQNTENSFGIRRVKSLSHMKKQAMSSPASLLALRTLLVWEWLLMLEVHGTYVDFEALYIMMKFHTRNL